MNPGLGPQFDSHPSGRAVGHEHRNRVRRDPTRSLLFQDVVLCQQSGGAADTTAEAHPEPLLVEFGVGESGVVEGFIGGDDRDLLAAVEPALPHS